MQKIEAKEGNKKEWVEKNKANKKSSWESVGKRIHRICKGNRS